MSKILVVEDEALIRLAIVQLLEEAGYETYEAGDSESAIRLLERHQDIRVVVTDVDMPGSMDGVRLAHYVRSKWPPIKLVVVSGKVGLSPLLLPEGTDFLSKPYEERKMLALLEELTA